MPEFAADLDSGHNAVATVFAECHSMYRQDGPEAERSLGETEFVAGQAAMGDSGSFSNTRACAVMFGNVDVTMGDKIEPLLDRHMERSGGRGSRPALRRLGRPVPCSNRIFRCRSVGAVSKCAGMHSNVLRPMRRIPKNTTSSPAPLPEPIGSTVSKIIARGYRLRVRRFFRPVLAERRPICGSPDRCLPKRLRRLHADRLCLSDEFP